MKKILLNLLSANIILTSAVSAACKEEKNSINNTQVNDEEYDSDDTLNDVNDNIFNNTSVASLWDNRWVYGQNSMFNNYNNYYDKYYS